MDAGHLRLDGRIDQLSERVARLEARLASLERQSVVPAAFGAALPPPARTPETLTASAVPSATGGGVFLGVGRVVLILGGGYLLRALTDTGLWPASVGVLLGLAYAGAWMVLADRAAVRGADGAAGYAVAAVLIALPLTFEATVRFRLLSAPASAAVLAGVTGALLLLAWRGHLRDVAWVATLAAIAVGAALMSLTRAWLPYAVVLTLLGAGTVWLGYSRGWGWLRWPAALAADLAVLAVVVRAGAPRAPETPAQASWLALLLMAVYLVTFAVRTLVLGRRIIVFEAAQSCVMFAVGLGGVVYLVRAGLDPRVWGVALVVLSAATYAVAFRWVGSTRHVTNFHFYASLAVVVGLVGSGMMLGVVGKTVLWSALAVAGGWLGHRLARATLSFHGLLYGTAAAAASGLLACGTFGLVVPASVPWRDMTAIAWVALGALGVVAVIPVAPFGEAWGRHARIVKILVLALMAWIASGVVVCLLTPALAGAPGAGANPGVVATVRTAALVAAILALARAAAWEHAGAALVTPILLLTGLKLLVEDFTQSQPATLFLALFLYGLALILAPRWARRAPSQTAL